MHREKVVLAYSGGLDTSVAIKWLQDKYDLDVIAIGVNVGQSHNKDDIVARALRNGAFKSDFVDRRKEFVEEYIWPALKANAMYQDAYPLSTAIARPLIVKTLVEFAQANGAKYIAHGCTAKGNDQVRFDVGVISLDPSLKIIGPMREWVMTREEEIEYAKQNGIEILVKKENPFSVDENLWGRSCECGVLENAWLEPPEEAWGWTTNPKDATNEAEYLTIDFEKGIPIAINDKRLGSIEIVETLNKIACKHGVGRIDHVEDRLIGIKSRETYECPAATVLLKAHKALEFMTLQKDVLEYKRSIEQKFSEILYNGLWFGVLRESLQSFIDKTQEFVTGSVRVKLFKGNVMVVGRKSLYSLYDEGLATYAKGDGFDHKSAVGFIYCWGLPNKTVATVHKK
ncbi:MAG: argininosuccinate synthase [archaeon]|nr:argininosuccinate synthase [archaeon]